MKTLLTLAIILTTIATEAQVVNIHEPDKVYAEIPHTYTPTTGYRWPRYHTRTHAHYDEGWRDADTMPVCDEGYAVANVAWTLSNDVAVVTWDCEPIPEPPPPQVVTKFRFWLAFYAATGMSNRDVEAEILDWPESPERAQALIALDSARDYRRGNQFVETLREHAGMSNAEMDAVFVAAAELEVD